LSLLKGTTITTSHLTLPSEFAVRPLVNLLSSFPNVGMEVIFHIIHQQTIIDKGFHVDLPQLCSFQSRGQGVQHGRKAEA
jgi:hypothetical protein